MGKVEKTHHPKGSVHRVLAHSYSFYFLLFLLGVYFDLVFNLKLFNTSIVVPIGVVLLIFSTWLIFWAQKTSRNLKKENLTKESFCGGPYSYTRSPTHVGLFFLMLGFGMVTNAFFVTLLSAVSFIITKFIFLNQEEKILAEKYGAPYLEYKKMVKF